MDSKAAGDTTASSIAVVIASSVATKRMGSASFHCRGCLGQPLMATAQL